MYKKSILSVAIASSLMLTGCFENNQLNDENTGSITNPPSSETSAALAAKRQLSYPVFSPASGEFPTPNDLLIQRDSTTTAAIEQSDGSFAIPGSGAADASPPVIALENLSGASVVAPIDIEIGNIVPGGGNVDETTLDARSFVVLGASIVPNPTQNVFLIELEYASDSPLTALSAGEKPTVSNGILALKAQAGDPTAVAALTAEVARPSYDAKVVTLTKSNGADTTYIRINPLKPLNPNKRYIIVVTDGVKDLNDESLIRSPGAAGYEALSDPTVGLASPALAPIGTLINTFWEAVASSYFAGLTNPVRANLSQDPLGEENIVFSISFTTSNDAKVIDYMAEPNAWITDTIKSMVKGGAAKAAIAGGAADYTATKAVVDGALAAWTAESFNPLLAGCDAFPAGDARFNCAGTNLESYLGTLGISFPKPTADTDMTFAGQRDLRTVSAAITDAIATAGTVNISEGTLTIPYFLERPNTRGVADASIAKMVNGWWKADAALATGLGAAFSLTLPQAIPGVDSSLVQSNVVNSFFPFPVANSTEEIPVLAIYPASDVNKPVDGYKTVIYQHGITTDRSVALTMGSYIVANSGGTVAVLAIDQPLHGVDATADFDKGYWAETFLTGGTTPLFTPDGTIDGTLADPAGQASIDAAKNGTLAIGALQQIQAALCPALAGLDLTGATPADIGTAIAAVTGGSCGGTAAAQYAGAKLIVDTVANSASQIPGLPRDTANERHFDFAAVNLVPTPMDFTNGTVGTSPLSAIGRTNTGSGAMSINIANFLTSRDNFRQQITDLLTLRLSIPTMDIDGIAGADLNGDDVHFIGHSLGTFNGIPFVEIANQTATTADDIKTANFLTPGGGIARLAENSPTFAPAILLGLKGAAQAAGGDLDRGDTDLESFLKVFQAAFDSFDPINFVGNLSSTTSPTKALFTEVIGDVFIPNNAVPAVDILNPLAGNASFGPGTDAPLAGTDPLETISGATTIDATTPLGINFLRFAANSGAKHTTPVAAATPGEQLAFAQLLEISRSIVMDEEVNIVYPGLIEPAL
jgi:hypothetical protein